MYGVGISNNVNEDEAKKKIFSLESSTSPAKQTSLVPILFQFVMVLL